VSKQTIYLKMVDIAQAYDPPYRQRYLDAAKSFRLPYLDYFRPRGGEVTFPGQSLNDDDGKTSFPYDFRLPDILNEKKVALRLPPQNVLQYDIDNPLYTYHFTQANGQLPPADQKRIVRSFQSFCCIEFLTSGTESVLLDCTDCEVSR
jgi:tyrosinase